MKRKTQLAIFIVLILFSFAACKNRENRREALQRLQNGDIIKGKVLKTMNSGGYTYLNVDTGRERLWVAIPETSVKTGETVSLVYNMEMRNFTSRTLKRQFDRIIFSTGIIGRPPKAHSQTAGGMMSMPPAKVSGEPVSFPKGLHIEKAQGKNAYTIGEIYAKRQDLNGTTVQVAGYVVKALQGIMGKNWIHIQDGTGSSTDGTNDLAVTTKALVNTGDIVLARGKLFTDKDFGAGYRYKAIIEDAEVVKR